MTSKEKSRAYAVNNMVESLEKRAKELMGIARDLLELCEGLWWLLDEEEAEADD